MKDHTTELIEWRDIPGHEGRYEVSNTGLIRGKRDTWRRVFKAGRILRGSMCGGRLNVALFRPDGTKDRQYIHRLVMLVFVGECPKGLVVNHIDGNIYNNSIDNLEYCTSGDNTRHARDVLGTIPVGIDRSSAKLDGDKVREIRKLYAAGMNYTDISRRFGVAFNTIKSCVLRKTWKHIE